VEEDEGQVKVDEEGCAWVDAEYGERKVEDRLVDPHGEHAHAVYELIGPFSEGVQALLDSLPDSD
jgi:hypothetical protein